MPRYRITFAKTEAMRFTGNLDVHRTWERTFRRAGLPLAYTQGFSPHPRLVLAAALPLGCLSENDLFDVWLTDVVQPATVLSDLERTVPPGLRAQGVNPVEGDEPALPSQIHSAEFAVEFNEVPAGETLATRCHRLEAAGRLPRTRRGKPYDLRPLIEFLRADDSGRGLVMRLAAREGATGRPDEVLLEMGIDPARAVCRRTKLVLKETFGPQPSAVS
jgi:radical SAM-linked protein